MLPSDVITIFGFDQQYVFAGTGVHAPIILSCIGSDGNKYRQLLKSSDDLRQDAVMEQVFRLVNSLLDQRPLSSSSSSTLAKAAAAAGDTDSLLSSSNWNWHSAISARYSHLLPLLPLLLPLLLLLDSHPIDDFISEHIMWFLSPHLVGIVEWVENSISICDYLVGKSKALSGSFFSVRGFVF